MGFSDDYSTRIHEASHFVAADFFHIPSYPEITPGGYSQIAESTTPHTAGLCHFEEPVTQFQRAVICWAGIIGEVLYGTAPFWAPPFKPCARNLRDFYSMMMHQLQRLSDTDRAGILGCHRNRWRAFKSAFNIVRKNRPRIMRLAKAMTGERKEPSMPMPAKFPVAFTEFLERIVAADGAANPEEKLRSFVSDQTAKFFAEKQFALEPADRQRAMETWTTARLGHYQRGFACPEAWRNAAAAFRRWTKTAPAAT